jgi:signal transduction histidine kinase
MPRVMSAACSGWISGVIGLWRRQRGIQFWLRQMVFSCILPSVAMAAFLVAHSYQRDRAGVEASTIEIARALMQTVDQELAGVQSALQVLATSPYIASGNLAGFHAQALTVLPTQTFNTVMLADATGYQLANTVTRFGNPLPFHGNPNQLKRVMEMSRPMVLNLHGGGVTHRHLIDVVLHGKAVYALSGGVFSDRLNEVLDRQHLPPGWVAHIFDSAGTLVAQSPNIDQVIGRQASPLLLRSLAKASEGVMNSVGSDGVPVFVSFSRSAVSGWSLTISMPAADVTADMQHSLWLSVAAAGLLLTLGLIWARSIGGHISRSIAALKEPALALASDQHLALAFHDIREVGEVGEALVGASRLLDQRTTERAKAEAEVTDTMRRLTERTAELERSSTDLEQFAYVASHDLKAPLWAIEHLADWISEDVAATARPETAENLTLLHARVTRMQMLLDGLLAYARICRSESVAKAVDTGAMVHDIAVTLAPPPGFIVTCEGPMPVIRTHRIPLERVLQNLIENGLKHHGGAEGHITISARLDAGTAEFRVSDDGPGIAPLYHERIFVMFQTLVSRDEIESSGIGLAIVKKTVELHGGKVWVESAPPARGTTFAFTWKEDKT